MPSPPLECRGWPWVKGSKMVRRRSAGMPMPVSRTRSTACSPSSSSARLMRLLSGLYFEALSSRFATTCCSRLASPRTGTGCSGSAMSSCCRLSR